MSEIASFIPSIIHKKEIKELCRPLNLIGDIGHFVVYIIFNDGHQFVLSSTPENFLSHYWVNKFNLLDHSAKIESFGNSNYYFAVAISVDRPAAPSFV
jgi:hypothetical protein